MAEASCFSNGGNIRLGVLTDRSIAKNGGDVLTNTPNGRLIAALRARSASLTLAASTLHYPSPDCDFDLRPHDINIIEGPYVPSISRGFFHVSATRRMVHELERRCDVVLVQMPFAAVTALFAAQKPRVYQMAGDIRSMATATGFYRGVKGLMARSAAEFYEFCHHRLLRRPGARLIAHGNQLLHRYGTSRGRSVVSSTLYRNEIRSAVRKRPLKAPFRVTYVGYLRHEKGVDVLLEAFAHLLDAVPNAELEIIGEKDLTDHGVSTNLRREAEKLAARASVFCRGHLPFGPELFQAYADADVCVVPSRSEGTPRVLIEARAFGCPVIGTNISGIPDSIDHERDGLLVPPGDAVALAQAMQRIALDRNLRDRLVAHGFERASRTTIDDFADAIFGEIEKAVATNRVSDAVSR